MNKIKNAFAFGKYYGAELLAWNRAFFENRAQIKKNSAERLKNNLSQEPSAQEILNAPYYFVLSTGRCGTALLTTILQEAPKLNVQHEPQPVLEFVSSYIHHHDVSQEALKTAILAARFDAHFAGSCRVGRTYVETNNRITFFASALAELLPNAKFVHLVRHPGDFVRSGMRRGYYEEGDTMFQRLDDSGNSQWADMTQLEKVCWEWNEINNKIEEFKANDCAGKVLTINSESLFGESKKETTAKLFQFMGTQNPFSSSQGESRFRQIFKKPINKQIQGSFPKYKDWTTEDKQALINITGELASQYGYQL